MLNRWRAYTVRVTEVVQCVCLSVCLSVCPQYSATTGNWDEHQQLQFYRHIELHFVETAVFKSEKLAQTQTVFCGPTHQLDVCIILVLQCATFLLQTTFFLQIFYTRFCKLPRFYFSIFLQPPFFTAHSMYYFYTLPLFHLYIFFYQFSIVLSTTLVYASHAVHCPLCCHCLFL